jgi:hypothetical protein
MELKIIDPHVRGLNYRSSFLHDPNRGGDGSEKNQVHSEKERVQHSICVEIAGRALTANCVFPVKSPVALSCLWNSR